MNPEDLEMDKRSVIITCRLNAEEAVKISKLLKGRKIATNLDADFKIKEGLKVFRNNKKKKWMAYDPNAKKFKDIDWNDEFRLGKTDLLFEDFIAYQEFCRENGVSPDAYIDEVEFNNPAGPDWNKLHDYDDIALAGDEGNISRGKGHGDDMDYYSRFRENKVVMTGCCHVSTCPMFITGSDPNKVCNVRCGGQHCIHWSTCKPPEKENKYVPACTISNCKKPGCVFYHKGETPRGVYIEPCKNKICDKSCGKFHRRDKNSLPKPGAIDKKKNNVVVKESMGPYNAIDFDDVKNRIGQVRVVRGGGVEMNSFFVIDGHAVSVEHIFENRFTCSKCPTCVKHKPCLSGNIKRCGMCSNCQANEPCPLQKIISAAYRFENSDWINLDPTKNRIGTLLGKDISSFSLSERHPGFRAENENNIKVDEPIMMMVPISNDDNDKIRWISTFGKITKVDKENGIVYYDAPTTFGYCGAAVQSRTGKIIGVHCYGDERGNIVNNSAIILTPKDHAIINRNTTNFVNNFSTSLPALL